MLKVLRIVYGTCLLATPIFVFLVMANIVSVPGMSPYPNPQDAAYAAVATTGVCFLLSTPLWD